MLRVQSEYSHNSGLGLGFGARDQRSATTHGTRQLAQLHSIAFVKHAGDEALDRLEPLLLRLRVVPGVMEKKRGTFYRKSSALVHFHEDGSELFADIRTPEGWERIRVTTKRGQTELLKHVRQS